VRYLSHVRGRGIALFTLVCEQDLEGIVAKPTNRIYGAEHVPSLPAGGGRGYRSPPTKDDLDPMESLEEVALCVEGQAPA